VKHVGLVVKDNPEALKTAEALSAWLKDKGIRVSSRKGFTEGVGFQPVEAVPPDLFCVFVLGGDGTLHLALCGLSAVFAPMAALTAAWGLAAYRLRLTDAKANADV
jgi:NAD kinase